MRILLVHPRAGDKVVLQDKFAMHEPLALEYLAAALTANHDVRILDMRIDDDLTGAITSFNPCVVATTGFTIHVNTCKRILKAAKLLNPNILTVIGGHHATVRPDDYYDPYIDVIVVGEGVFAFRSIVEHCESGGSLRDIDGIIFRHNDTYVKNKPRAYTDLDALPFPARALTRENRHLYHSAALRPLASIRTSLGCLYRCNYCALWQITQGDYLTRNPESVVRELGEINEPYVFFADDESFLLGDRMLVLAELIKAAQIRKQYRLFARSDTLVKMRSLLEKWRDIGLRSVVVGFEGISDDDLRRLNKATTKSTNEAAIKLLNDLNIEVCADFMITQDFSRDKFRRLYEYVQGLGLKTVIFPILTPLPGTALYEETHESIITRDYDLYDFKHTILPTEMPLQEFYAEFAKLHLLMFPAYRRWLYRYFFDGTRFIPSFKQGYEVLHSLKRLYKDHLAV